MNVDITGVVVNEVRFLAPSTFWLCATGLFEMTSQCSGVTAVKVNVALRSGWSKHAYMRRASATSN